MRVYLSDVTKLNALAECIRLNYDTSDSYSLSTLSNLFLSWQSASIDPYQYYNNVSAPGLDFGRVRLIGEAAFAKCTGVTSAIAPMCTVVEESAFFNANNLSVISFPECSILGNNAFAGTALTKLSANNLPRLSVIPEGAFANCSALSSITYRPNIVIEKNAFQSCTNIDRFEPIMPADVDLYAFSDAKFNVLAYPEYSGVLNNAWFGNTEILYIDAPHISDISQSFYSGIQAIHSVSFPTCKYITFSRLPVDAAAWPSVYTWGVTDGNLEPGVFSNVNNLHEVYFSKYTKIQDYEFYNCSNLSIVSIPNCTKIGASAFYNCKISSVAFPSCSTIGDMAFAKCSSISAVNLPEGKIFGSGVFTGCTKIKELILPQYRNSTAISYYASYFGSTLKRAEFYDVGFAGGQYVSMYPALQELVLTSQPYISATAMYSHPSIKLVSCPNCTYIDTSAFAECINLISASFPACTYFGSYAFYNCTNLSSVYFDEATTIGSHAFDGCTTLANKYRVLSIPECSSVGTAAFNGFTGIETLYAPALNIDTTDVGWNTTTILDITIGGMSYPYFANATRLECRTLSTYLYSSTTASMSRLAEIICPACTTIMQSAFQYMKGLISASFPACTSLGISAFHSCTALNNVNLTNCVTIGSTAFDYCQALTDIELPNCELIYNSAFRYCDALISISIPKCTRLYSDAFYGCSALQSITLPATCSQLGQETFFGCYALSNIYLMYDGVVSGATLMLESTPFAGYSEYAEAGYIYVPSAYYSSYVTASYWSEYSAYISAI